MCGIAGSIGCKDAGFAEAMTTALAHRGPDSASVWSSSHASWAHTRLSIIGLGSGGEQPFVTQDGRFTVIYNGEIYNHSDLRRRYGIDAAPTDGAILPDLWARLGPDCLAQLRGMYSMAVWDDRSGRCWLAVDPMGMKPLYLAAQPPGYYFASEVTPLAQYLGLEVDRLEAIQEFGDWGCLSTDSAGVHGARRLAPGTVVEFGPGGQLSGSTTVDVVPWRRSGQSWSDVVNEFRQAVDIHLQADVPTALLLSSGVDSAAIAWAAAEAGRRLSCVTLDFAGGTLEADMAVKVAKRFGHQHEVIDSASAVDEYISDFLDAVDRPSIDGLNTYLACRLLRERGFRVALSGAGGDELLLGYAHHRRRGLPNPAERLVRAVGVRAMRRSGPDRQVPHALDSLVRMSQALARGGLSRVPRQRVRAARSHRPLLNSLDLGSEEPLSILSSSPRTVTDEFVLSEWMNYLVPMLLADADVYSMAVGVEMRLPFVDLGVWGAVLGITERKAGKRAFVTATGDALLEEVLLRPKTGFDVPFWRAANGQSVASPATEGGWIDERHARLNVWRSLVWDAWDQRIGTHYPGNASSGPRTPLTAAPRTQMGQPARSSTPASARIALVTQTGRSNGGVGSIVQWLDEGLRDRGHCVEIHQLAASSADDLSSRFLRPATWLKAPDRVYSESGETRWGARFVELETNRYLSNSALTADLDLCDVVVVVSGSPALANVVTDVSKPTFLLAATTMAMERPARLGESRARRFVARGLLPALNRLDRRGVNCVDSVFVLNEYMLQWCRANGQERVELTPPGIDPSVFYPPPFWSPQGPIVALGRLSEQRKAWPTVVEAFDQLAEVPEFRNELLIAGRGPVTADLLAAIRSAKNAARITVMEDVASDQLPEMLRTGSVFVQASLEEGLGIAGLEGMACGLPMVSTATVGSSEYVRHGENGFLVPLGGDTATHLACSVGEVLSTDGLGQKMSRAAVKTVRDTYDTSHALDAITDKLMAAAARPYAR